tara:strand:+ start:700 stop:930 length:231 start_codon:yes stop_codon:yes gene_type:complete
MPNDPPTRSPPKAPANTGRPSQPEWREPKSRQAFLDGKNAAAREGNTDCPHPEGTIEYHMWLQGYAMEREWQDGGK